MLRADVCMKCKYRVNSPESTSILTYLSIERLLMVTDLVTVMSAVSVNELE